MSDLGDYWLAQHSSVEVAWLAGIYEGEGTLFPNRSGGSWQMAIAMTDEDVVRRCHAIAGVGTVRAKPPWKTKYKPQTAWRIHRATEIEFVLELILPFLGERRRAKADQFLAWKRITQRCENDADVMRRASRSARASERRAEARQTS